MKKQRPEFTQVYSQVLQQVAVRVDLAFKAFFRRVKARAKTGEKAGFPRYKGPSVPIFFLKKMQKNRRSFSDAAWSLFTLSRIQSGIRPLILNTPHKIALLVGTARRKHSLIVCIIAKSVAIQQTETSMLR